MNKQQHIFTSYSFFLSFFFFFFSSFFTFFVFLFLCFFFLYFFLCFFLFLFHSSHLINLQIMHMLYSTCKPHNYRYGQLKYIEMYI